MSDERMPAWAEALRADLALRLDNVRADVTAVRADVMARIDRLQHRVDAMHDDIKVNFGRADRVDGRARGLESIVNALADEVTGMERQIMRLRAEMDELKGKGG